jgi:hypothetical protein
MCKMSKTIPFSPLHLAATIFVALELPWLQIAHFEEFVDTVDVLCSVTDY